MMDSQKEVTLETLDKVPVKSNYILSARLAKLKYQLWLASLREISIIQVLMTNYDKIPSRTPSKIIVGLFVKFSWMNKMLCKVEKSLRRRIY